MWYLINHIRPGHLHREIEREVQVVKFLTIFRAKSRNVVESKTGQCRQFESLMQNVPGIQKNIMYGTISLKFQNVKTEAERRIHLPNEAKDEREHLPVHVRSLDHELRNGQEMYSFMMINIHDDDVAEIEMNQYDLLQLYRIEKHLHLRRCANGR